MNPPAAKSAAVSIALLSCALIGSELALMQSLSLMQWHHFAFMIISVALLGFGASGSLISIYREKFLKQERRVQAGLMIFCGLSLSLVVQVIQLNALRFDSFLVFMQWSEIAALGLTCLILFVPFFLGALPIGIAFVTEIGSVGRLYFANLLGSAAGALVSVMLMWLLLPQQIVALLALLALAAGLRILPKLTPVAVAASLAGIAFSGFTLVNPPEIIGSEYKALSKALHLPGATILLQRNSPHGLIHVVSADALRSAPGVSLAYKGVIPSQQAVFNNGDWFGGVMKRSRVDSTHVLDHTTFALPFEMGQRKNVLVLHAGTGTSVAHAVARGADRVTAVEPHSTLVSLLRNELAAETDSLFVDPRVTVSVMDPRTYLLTDTGRYDLISLPAFDAFGGTAGVYALQEQWSLTKEAFSDMWKLLSGDGVISVTCWMDEPVRNPLRLLATMAEVLEELGVQKPLEHIAAVRSWGTLTIVVKRSAMTGGETENIRSFCSRMLFDPLLLPELRHGEREVYNRLNNPSFFGNVDALFSPQRDSIVGHYDFNIAPPTDDRPYFSQFLRWTSVFRLRDVFGAQTFPFIEIGYLVVILAAAQIALLSVLLVLLPVIRSRDLPGGRWVMFSYFGGLGLGYMFVEMVMIQRLGLFFGHPVIAAAIVIAGMLASSGAGSYFFSARITSRQAMGAVIAVLIASLVVYAEGSIFVLKETTGWGIGGKIAVAFLLLAPPAIMMGIPFPAGLRLLTQNADVNVAWAWGVNGCLSVVGTVVAPIASVEGGFLAVMALSIVAYGAAGIAAMWHVRIGTDRRQGTCVA